MKNFTQTLFTASRNTFKLLSVLILMFAFNFNLSAQAIGIFESYVITSTNGGANTFYDLGPQATVSPDFQGNNLGSFVSTSTLVVKGGQNKTFKNGGGIVTGGNLYYRVWLTSVGASGTFVALPMSFVADLVNVGDQQWEGTTGTTNILNGLPSGSYTLEVYTDAPGTPATAFANNGGSNYRATFTLVNPVSVTATGGTLAANYATLAAAITAINAGTHTGTVVCSVSAGHIETAPIGGYSITATGTAGNTITFIKNGVGANPVLTAQAQTPTGLLNDAIFKIIGGDFITIDGFTLQERTVTPLAADTASTTNTMTEFGIALFYATATNNCQNITLRNNTITLNRAYQNTFGIYANATHTATAVTTAASGTGIAGGNNNLIIAANNINNVNMGIVVVGPTAIADVNTNVTIGGATAAEGNIISNFGTTGTFSSYANVSGTVNGILIRNTNGFSVRNNTVSSSVGGVTAGTLNGIQQAASSAVPTTTFTNVISNNIISLRSGLIAGAMNGITIINGSASLTSIFQINNNDFNNFGHTVAGTGAITFINNASTHLTFSVINNTFTNINVNTTGSVTFVNHNYTMPSNGTQTFDNNRIITSFTKTGVGGTITGFTSAASSPTGSTHTLINNFISNIFATGSTAITGVNNSDGFGGSANRIVTGNNFNNWSTGTGAISGMNYSYIGAISTFTNTLTNFSNNGSITGLNIGNLFNGGFPLNIVNNIVSNFNSTLAGAPVVGINTSTTSPTINVSGNLIHSLASTANIVTALSASAGSPVISKNKIYNISSSGAAAVVSGLLIAGGTTFTVDNNIIGDLRATTASLANAVNGINITGGTTVNAYFNTIRLNATSTGTNFGSSAISTAIATLNLRNNILVNTSTANGTGFTVALRRAVAALTTYAATSNNNLLYAGTPSTTNLLYNDGTNSEQTLSGFKTRVATSDANSITENAPFLSTVGTDAAFLHIDPTIATGIEKGAIAITGFTSDYDNDVRGSIPDIGADEGTFTPLPAPVITSLGATSGCQGTSLVVTGTNMSGVTSATIGGTAAVVTATTATTATLTIGTGTTGTVTVTSPAGSATSAASFTVNLAPTTTWSSSATAVCFSATAQTASLAYGSTTNAPINYSIIWSPTPTNSFVAVTNQSFSGTAGGGTISLNVPAGTVAGTYTGTIKTANANGCDSANSTFSIVVNQTPIITINTAASTVCSNVTIVPLIISGASSNNIVTQGTGLLLTTAATTTANLGPNPFQSYFGGSKQQMLLTATELSALGLVTGNKLTSIAFNMSAVETRTLLNYTVNIQNSTLSSFANTNFIIGGFTNVRAAASYLPATGWNTLVLDSSVFTYNGGSLLVEITFSNNDGGGTGSNIALFSNTSFASTLFYRVDTATAVAVASATVASFSLNARNNIRFGVNSSLPVTWTPITGLFTDAAASVPYTAGQDFATIYARPSASTTYTATATTANSCTATVASIITANPTSVAGTASAPQTICSGTIPSSLNLIGNTGTIQWQSSIDNIAFTNISGQTTATLALAALTATTYYRAVVTSGTCIAANSNVVTISVTPNTFSDTTISSCDSYAWATTGATYTASGIYIGTPVNCVTPRLNLTITPSSFNDTTLSACDTYTWATTGTTYTTSGIYLGTEVNCVTPRLNLTITPGSFNDTTISSCDSYVWAENGITYSTSGIYLGTPVNCVTPRLDLTITPSSLNNTSANGCDSYTWPDNNVTYITSGSYVGTTTNCVTQILNLTIEQSTFNDSTVSACDSYTWANNSTNYTTSGIYTGTTINCVTERLNLTITPSSFNDTAVTACSTYTWANNSTNYTTSGTYVGTTTNCVTERLILTITPLQTPTFATVAPICSGDILSALPTTSLNGYSGTWSPALDNTTTTTYTFTPSGCATPTTLTIVVGGTKVWNAGWTPAGAPTSIDAVTIMGNYTASTDGGTINACSMTVDNNAVVLIDNDFNIILQGALTVTSGSVTINNNSNLLQTRNTANTGNITIKRNSSALFRLDYTQWSSPVTGTTTLQQFSPSTTNTRFYNYNSATNLYSAYLTPNTVTFDVARGYHIRMPNNWVAAPVAPAKYTGIFSGVPTNGSQTFTMNNTGAGLGFNLVGNPYPSDISMTSFVTANSSNITGTLYFWRKTNNASAPSYSTWAGGTFNQGTATATDPNGIISVGQGFMVAAAAGQTNLVFNNTMRFADNVDQFFRGNNTIDYNRIWLNATNATGSFCQSTVGYITGATSGVDQSDGLFFNDGDINLTSLIGTDNYAIQGRALPFAASDIVPLSFKATTAGNYTIAIDHVDGLFIGSSDIYLKDNLNGTTNNLTTGAYNFAANSGIDNSRFELVYSQALATNNVTFNDNNVIVYKNNNTININSGSQTISNVKVFDIRGSLLVEKNNLNATQTAIDSSSFANQVLVITITDSNGLKVSKKIVN